MRIIENHLEFKVLRTHSKTYDEIEQVGVITWHLTSNGYFVWKATSLTLSTNIIRKDWLIQLVKFFYCKNIALTPEAVALIEQRA